MLRIPCPHCGVRDHSEFTYLGDANAHSQRPGEEAVQESWFEYLYLRNNPRGPHRELWHHSHGCRAWLVVQRDTLTHAVSGACLATEFTGETAS